MSPAQAALILFGDKRASMPAPPVFNSAYCQPSHIRSPLWQPNHRLSIPNHRPIELPLNKAVPVEVIRGLEGKEGRHPHDHGTEDLVADVEVVAGEAALLVGQDAVIGILGRELRHRDPKRWSLLHALEDEVHSERVLLRHFA